MFLKIPRGGPKSIPVRIALPASNAVRTAARCACAGTGKRQLGSAFRFNLLKQMVKRVMAWNPMAEKIASDNIRRNSMKFIENAEFNSRTQGVSAANQWWETVPGHFSAG